MTTTCRNPAIPIAVCIFTWRYPSHSVITTFDIDLAGVACSCSDRTASHILQSVWALAGSLGKLHHRPILRLKVGQNTPLLAILLGLCVRPAPAAPPYPGLRICVEWDAIAVSVRDVLAEPEQLTVDPGVVVSFTLVERLKLCTATDRGKALREVSLDAYEREMLLGRRKLFGSDSREARRVAIEQMPDPRDD